MAATTLFLNGCGTVAVSRLLPNGERSIMSAENTRVRAQLAVRPVPLPFPITYGPVARCSYEGVETDLAGRSIFFERDISVRQVQERLLISYRQGKSDSTALISQSGELIDFNTVQLDGTQTNTETFPAYAATRSIALRRRPHVFTHAINELKLAFPHYTSDRVRVGSVVAIVTDENGRPWAEYVYRGMVDFDGSRSAVLDLTKWLDRSTRLTIGFNIVDLADGLPRLYVFDSNASHSLKVKLQRCANG